jgi:hypothetical protein
MKKDYVEIIEKLIKEHDTKIEAVQKEIYEKLLVPFCKKYKLKFYAGMGVYSFEYETKKKYIDIYESTGHHNNVRIASNDFIREKLEAWKELITALEIRPYTNAAYPIGTYMDDYPRRS